MLKNTVRMIKYLPLLVLMACSSKSLLQKVSESERPLIKKVPVSSRQEAKKYIHNQRNFLVLLFEQSRDPYYGTPKWNEACLQDNRIGDVQENEKAIFLSSRLFLDAAGTPGFCFGGEAKYGQHVVVYCEGKSEILDMKFITQRELNLSDFKLCE